MRRALIATVLAVSCVGFAAADDTQTVPDRTRVRIEVDPVAVEGFVRNMQEYTQTQGAQEIAYSAAGVAQSLDNAFKNTFAKIMLNYGKTYAPAFEHYGEAAGKAMTLDKKSKCNQDCAA